MADTIAILDSLTGGVTTPVVESGSPAEFSLSQNMPNPFNLSTTIGYSLPQNSHITLSIYSISGQRVSVLKDEYLPSGNYSATWDAKGFPSGLYFCILQANGFIETRKMMLVKWDCYKFQVRTTNKQWGKFYLTKWHNLKTKVIWFLLLISLFYVIVCYGEILLCIDFISCLLLTNSSNKKLNVTFSRAFASR